jgi:phospholipase C
VWDLPSLPGHAEDNGVIWKGYTGSTGYPLEFYQQLKGSANIVTSKSSQQFRSDAADGELPALSMIWHDSPADEHPLADVSIGMNEIWKSIDAVVQAGLWDQTVFLLTWDDWGGYDDHVVTPALEYTPDNVQLAYGPRVPLLMFGSAVKQAIDNRWCGHASIPSASMSCGWV